MARFEGFITNLGKYNEGNLIGKWIHFPINEEDLEKVLEEIGINKEYEEYFFTDWDLDFNVRLGEHERIEALNEVAKKIDDLDEIQTLQAVCEYDSPMCLKQFSDLIDEIDEWYLEPNINNDYDLGYYWVHEAGCYDLDSMGNLANYIDYEAFGRDIRFEAEGNHTVYGWVEKH